MSNDTESLDMTETQSMPDVDAPSPSPVANRPFKSFKRKYGKQKIKFELAMRDGTALVREEMRIQDLSKRLREQNDQLLELLLELNNTVHIPRSLRYGLTRQEDSRLHTTMSEPTDSIPVIECDAQTARAKLNEAKQKLLAGEMTADECRELELSMLKSSTFAPSTSISSLLASVPHTSLSSEDCPDSDIDSSLGYIHPEDDLDYPVPGTEVHIDLTSARASSKHLSPADREKAAIIRNPSSVYNWLRKNKPQVLTHDPEAPPAGNSASGTAAGTAQSEKPAATPRPSSTRTSKRASAQIQRDEEVYDDDGMLIDVAEPAAAASTNNAASGSARGKRKRDEDGVYHPKGGNRGKKKKEDKRTKRPSTASAAA
ncbi:uncharacterized protein GIQ15_06879 [Arthroderma uncinatum]|uniref:uncharacterized protein n=1 Tax=Arthroderma uncinatum TaxID=74035 RepID=UPI00144AB6D5|nr:uncharacterized protein GIQ15_06879 [Arthroderma uncinatum]KAF3479903.1 hypothetical protein GIQ15_06879 [Arthroderma uncinatum]